MADNLLPPCEETAAALPGPVEGLTISIVTAVLNQEALIGEAAASVAGQGLPSAACEHLIMDGGSTDGTLAALAGLPGLRVASGPDAGPHAAMNRGLTLAEGQVIGFLAADDIYLPGILPAVAAAFAADPAAQVVCGRALLAEAAPGEAPVVIGEFRHPVDPEAQFLELLFGAPAIGSWFFRTELLRRFGGFDESYQLAADRGLLIRLALAGVPRRVLPAPACRYLRHPGSRTLDAAGSRRLQILDEHRRLAGELLAEGGGSRWQRQALAAWGAWEGARAAKLKRRRLPAAAVAALASAPAMPLHLARVPGLRRRLRRALRPGD